MEGPRSVGERGTGARSHPSEGGLRDLLAGAGCLVRGLGIFAGTPGLWPLGLLPGLLALLLLGGAIVALALALPAVVDALTPFAARWSDTDRALLRTLVEAALLVVSVWLAIVSYAAVALAIGQPFYEAIAGRVEAREGGAPRPAREPRWRGPGRAVRDGVLVVALAASVELALFVLALVPFLGQTLGPAAGACVAGFFLAVELSGPALERRGLRLRDRMRLLWRHRWLALGFGLAAFLLFLIPFGAVLGMPGAVVGGTLLARRLAGRAPDRAAGPAGSGYRP